MAISDFIPSDLAKRVRQGNRDAEQELVERYGRGVWFVIRQLVAGDEAAEDAFQETFRLVFEKIRAGELRDLDRLSGFVTSIARFVTLAQTRRRSRQRVREVSGGGEREVPCPDASPLDKLLREERCLLARQTLADLASDRDRTVLHRFYIAGDDKAEICRDLGIASLHFNQILCRARDRYRFHFESRKGTK